MRSGELGNLKISPSCAGQHKRRQAVLACTSLVAKLPSRERDFFHRFHGPFGILLFTISRFTRHESWFPESRNHARIVSDDYANKRN